LKGSKKMAKILITGGAGFIAYHLAQKLQAEGHRVCGFDNYNDYYDVNLKYARARSLATRGIEVIKGDLVNLVDVDFAVTTFAPEIVIHLGAYAGVRHSLDHPKLYIDNNINGTHNLIEVCEKRGVNKIIYASTSCVMAGNELPWNESDKCGYQLNAYGYSKATNEAQFMASKVPVTIGLRFFTVYGPWGRPDMALFTFTKSIIDGTPIKLFNYGDMIRDFTYVDDIVQGVNIVINRAINTTQNLKEVYNIGNGEQVQLLDFVSEIEKNVGKEAIRELVEKHPADTQATWSDTTKLQALGYKPTTSVKVGVAKFVEWYKEYYEIV
jgi:UDP-glucuronate 4-epimerase